MKRAFLSRQLCILLITSYTFSTFLVSECFSFNRLLNWFGYQFFFLTYDVCGLEHLFLFPKYESRFKKTVLYIEMLDKYTHFGLLLLLFIIPTPNSNLLKAFTRIKKLPTGDSRKHPTSINLPLYFLVVLFNQRYIQGCVQYIYIVRN